MCTLNVLRILILIITPVLLNGCFYLVEEGKGGVAERFAINDQKITLQKRLKKCEATLKLHAENSQKVLFPARYQQAKSLVIESRRLYEAEFFTPAQHVLEEAEALLTQTEQSEQLIVNNSTCNRNTAQEICS
jgi:predicted DNA repair protein MutK